MEKRCTTCGGTGYLGTVCRDTSCPVCCGRGFYDEKEHHPDSAIPSTFLESHSGNEQMATYETPSPDPRACCELIFTHYRHRETDLDNLSTKALIDAFVDLGIFADDSPKYIKKISHQFVKTDKEDYERTELEIVYDG